MKRGRVMSTKGQKRLANVLMIDDSEPDIELTKIIMRHRRLHLNMDALFDGDDLIDLMKSKDPYLETVDLILLDFNLPKRNAPEVLHYMKNNQSYTNIPVIILTGSDLPEDKDKVLELGACAYMLKPFDENDFAKIITGIGHLSLVEKEKKTYLYADNKELRDVS